MYAARRQSALTPGPPPSPSPFSIPRPHSVTGTPVHSRTQSDAGPSDDTRNVRVVVRLKPSDPNDDTIPPRFRNALVHPTSPSELRVDVDPAALAGHASTPTAIRRHPTFAFDHVLGEDATQENLYDATARDVIDDFIKGHNVTFLAYGQTSSGKSYSMGTTGEDIDYSGTDFTPRTGLIPRTVHAVFARAEEVRRASGPGASWECKLSFLELYNEEIIDLLAGSGVNIQIREERDGRIVWSGVREVKVRSLAEVMGWLQEGSERRKTGETGMNATSSRSHAIFSMTLVQKKRIGGGAAVEGRSLKRPSSTLSFHGGGARSPTPSGSRPGQPPSAFGSIAKPNGLSRPSSMLLGNPIGHGEGGDGEFVIVTSKFNMVDLAGSERLKRTAAQGDRMKEGISINSGLLALGNVISTLCDPVKSRGHIPYRDSKLTRMLQDSIGGNSLTTMIACISPVEYNLSETLNTIKYASRARSIRNAAKVNAVEAGWDDVEHLQNTVLKLRKQISAMEGRVGVQAGAETGRAPAGEDKGTEKLMARLADLQKEHTELYDRYLAKCSDNMRLTSELRSAKPGDGDALAKFNEMVEPVILEYEKVVAALNQQLDDLRLELRALGEMYDLQEQQLQEVQARQQQSEAYVAELRGRVAKLTERNSTSEAYIRDLEAKLKTHAETDGKHSAVVTDLRREIAEMKKSNAELNRHTADLSARLVQSEGHTFKLEAQIEKQEKEAEQRETAYRDLEAHIAGLDKSRDHEILAQQLAEKERALEELQRERDEQMRGQRELSGKVEAERAVQGELLRQIAKLQEQAVLPAPTAQAPDMTPFKTPIRSPTQVTKELTPPDSPSSAGHLPTTPPPSLPFAQKDEVAQLKAALRELAIRCSDAETRYTHAQGQIADLSSQLSEAKLVHEEMGDVVVGGVGPLSPSLHSPGFAETDEAEEASEEDSTQLHTPILSPGLGENDHGGDGGHRRRGSLPIFSSAGIGKRDFRGGRGQFEVKRNRPQSLSQELSSAQPAASSSRGSWSGHHNSLLLGVSPTRPATQPPTEHARTLKASRSMQSLEAELKFVHRVVEERDEELKQQEEYIRQLEETLRHSGDTHTHAVPSRKNSAISLQSPASPRPQDIPLPPSPPVLSTPLTPTTPVPTPSIPPSPSPAHQSPEVVKRYPDLKQSLSNGKLSSASSLSTIGDKEPGEEEVAVVGKLQSQVVDELLREMAVKEASQREIIEQQFVQIADLQKANLKLREEVDKTLTTTAETTEDAGLANATAINRGDADAAGASDAVLSRIREEHADELQKLQQAHTQTIESLHSEHASAIDQVRVEMEKGQAAHADELRQHASNHQVAIAELKETHEAAIQALQDDHDLISSEMEASLSASEEQRRQLKMRADQAMFELSRVRDEHQMQRNVDAKTIAQLERAKVQLEQVRGELEGEKAELSSKLADLEQKYAASVRKSVVPPQGPPPTTPLPPLPLGLMSPSGGPSGNQTAPLPRLGRTPSSQGSAESENGHVGAGDAEMGRDALMLDKESLKQQRTASMKEVEAKLLEEKVKAENLTRDLHDARKTTSKLRAHLEDARQENKRVLEACKEHMEELEMRRARMDKISEESKRERDSLSAANAQVAHLRSQLDRAVEQQVNKKMGNRMKCF